MLPKRVATYWQIMKYAVNVSEEKYQHNHLVIRLVISTEAFFFTAKAANVNLRLFIGVTILLVCRVHGARVFTTFGLKVSALNVKKIGSLTGMISLACRAL